MIAGYLGQWDKEKQLHAPKLQTALAWLQATDLTSLPPGQQPIDGDNMFALVSEYMTEPKEKRRAEAHHKYVDIQYIVAGEERIGIAPLMADYEVLEDKLAEKDVIFYARVTDEVELGLKNGMFVVLFPWEVHRPNCAYDLPGKVRKVVVKISMDSL